MVKIFEVANIRCGGCAATITKALEEEAFTSVEVDLGCEPRKVSVEIESDEQEEKFKAILRKHGYPLVGEEISFVGSAGLKAKSFVSCAVGKFQVEENKK